MSTITIWKKTLRLCQRLLNYPFKPEARARTTIDVLHVVFGLIDRRNIVWCWLDDRWFYVHVYVDFSTGLENIHMIGSVERAKSHFCIEFLLLQMNNFIVFSVIARDMPMQSTQNSEEKKQQTNKKKNAKIINNSYLSIYVISVRWKLIFSHIICSTIQ